MTLTIGLIVALVRLWPNDVERRALMPYPQPEFTLPGETRGPQSPVSLVPSTPPAIAAPPPTRRPVRGAIREERVARAPEQVSGRYGVVGSFGDSFIGEVRITNDADRDRNWTVVLRFGDDVGELRTSWLEGLPQPTRSADGRTLTFRSSTPLAPGRTGLLRFQFDRPGSVETPERCTVNGAPCRP